MKYWNCLPTSVTMSPSVSVVKKPSVKQSLLKPLLYYCSPMLCCLVALVYRLKLQTSYNSYFTITYYRFVFINGIYWPPKPIFLAINFIWLNFFSTLSEKIESLDKAQNEIKGKLFCFPRVESNNIISRLWTFWELGTAINGAQKRNNLMLILILT